MAKAFYFIGGTVKNLLEEIFGYESLGNVPRKKFEKLIEWLRPGLAFESVLGEGGEGGAFACRDIFLDRIVTAKILLPGITGKRKERIFRGAQIQQKLHRAVKKEFGNIPDVLRLEKGEISWLEMEFAEGRQLHIAAAGKTELEKIQLLVRIAKLVNEAHRRGVIHRDLKPENILVDKGGNISLLDWAIGKEPERDTKLTRFNDSVIGSPAYASPEQMNRFEKEIDYRSDIYQLGNIFHILLAEKLPEKLRDVGGGVEVGYYDANFLTLKQQQIFLRAHQTRAADRFQSITELVAQIESLYELDTPPWPDFDPYADTKKIEISQFADNTEQKKELLFEDEIDKKFYDAVIESLRLMEEKQ
jgi:serine/threonine protein kinase